MITHYMIICCPVVHLLSRFVKFIKPLSHWIVPILHVIVALCWNTVICAGFLHASIRNIVES